MTCCTVLKAGETCLPVLYARQSFPQCARQASMSMAHGKQLCLNCICSCLSAGVSLQLIGIPLYSSLAWSLLAMLQLAIVANKLHDYS